MRLFVSTFALFALLGCLPPSAVGGGFLAEADSLYGLGGLHNYEQAIDVYLKALKASPTDYETSWKCARAYRQYGEEAKKRQVKGWEGLCAQYGKQGMAYAQQAMAQRPDRPEGHYYYGLSVGIYSDGVSVVTALRQGLKGKTQSSFEKAYALDRMYDKGGPILALGRFWAVLPWPMRNREKALAFYREFEATPYFGERVQAKVYLAELLLEMKGEGTREEAAALLAQAARCDEAYYRDWARRLLANMD